MATKRNKANAGHHSLMQIKDRHATKNRLNARSLRTGFLPSVSRELGHDVLHRGRVTVGCAARRRRTRRGTLASAVWAAVVGSGWYCRMSLRCGVAAQSTEQGVDIDVCVARWRCCSGRHSVGHGRGHGREESLEGGVVDLAHELGNVGHVGDRSGGNGLAVRSVRRSMVRRRVAVRPTPWRMLLRRRLVRLLVTAVWLLGVCNSGRTGRLGAEDNLAGRGGV